MNLDKIKSISFSLMKKESDIQDGKAEYTKKISAKFVIPKDVNLTEEIVENLVSKMFDDLRDSSPEDVDSLGLWIEYEHITTENAITLNTLNDIQVHSKQDINPIYEFFKMTLTE